MVCRENARYIVDKALILAISSLKVTEHEGKCSFSVENPPKIVVFQSVLDGVAVGKPLSGQARCKEVGCQKVEHQIKHAIWTWWTELPLTRLAVVQRLVLHLRHTGSTKSWRCDLRCLGGWKW